MESPFIREPLKDCPDTRILANVLRTVATYTCDENGAIMAAVSKLDHLPAIDGLTWHARILSSQTAQPFISEVSMELSDLNQEARELYCHASHSADIYKAYMVPAFVNLQKKFKKATFSYELGLKLLRQYTLVSVAKDYHRQHGTTTQPWHKLFTVQDRTNVAEVILDELLCEFRIGNFYT